MSGICGRWMMGNGCCGCRGKLDDGWRRDGRDVAERPYDKCK